MFIEIHGFCYLKAMKKRKEIFKSLTGKSFIGEVKIILFGTDVCDHLGKEQPFFRLYTSKNDKEEEVGDIISLLLDFGDVQHLSEEFYSKS